MRALCLLFPILVSVAIAGPVQTQTPWGAIDWSTRTVSAKGIGAPPPDVPIAAARPNAERAARMTALRNALEIVKGIPLTSTTTIDSRMTASDVVMTRVDGFLKGFQQQGTPRYMSDGTVEIVMEVALSGDLADAVLPAQITDTPSVTTASRDEKKPAFTGVIVDCSGLGVVPCMLPVILDEQSKIVYGPGVIARSFAVTRGAAGYADSVSGARADAERIGLKPLVVKPVKAAGQPRTDVVVSKKDGAALRGNPAVLRECRVIFVVN